MQDMFKAIRHWALHHFYDYYAIEMVKYLFRNPPFPPINVGDSLACLPNSKHNIERGRGE